MGAVYDGWDKNLGIRVAIKENLLFTEASQRQFEREARMLANLRHSNLPSVIDHFYIAGQGQYLVMSFIEGEDLAARLKRLGPLPEADVLRWADDVLNALAYLHKRGIIHRDIKPPNIKITPEGEAVLVDFGIAKEILDETGALTTTGARGLTPGFAPPEQYGGSHTDARSDIYAFGATLYMLLVGTPPTEALTRLAKPAKYVSLKRQTAQVSSGLAEAVDRALALDADDRWQSVEAMKEGLRLPAKVAPPKRKAGDEVETLPPGVAPKVVGQPEPRLRAPRFGIPAWIVGAVAVGVLALVAVYAANGRGASAAATSTVEPSDTAIVATATSPKTAKPTNTAQPSDTPVPPTASRTSTSTQKPDTATNTPTAAPPTSTRTATKASLPTQAATQQPVATISDVDIRGKALLSIGCGDDWHCEMQPGCFQASQGLWSAEAVGTVSFTITNSSNDTLFISNVFYGGNIGNGNLGQEFLLAPQETKIFQLSARIQWSGTTPTCQDSPPVPPYISFTVFGGPGIDNNYVDASRFITWK